MLISMNDMLVAQARCEDFHRQAAEDALAQQVSSKSVRQVVADRFTGARFEVGNWVGRQLIAWGERMQRGYTPHRV